MEVQASPYRDLPPEVRLVCVQSDIRTAIADVCSAWGLSGPEALMAVKAAVSTMYAAALESTAGELAHALVPASEPEKPME